MAADSASFHGDIAINDHSKIYRCLQGSRLFPAGTLIGMCGSSVDIKNVISFHDGGADKVDFLDKDDRPLGIALTPENVIYALVGYDHHQLGNDVAACGAAKEFAYGAMLFGASAAEAVALCIKCHCYAAGEVNVARPGAPDKAQG